MEQGKVGWVRWKSIKKLSHAKPISRKYAREERKREGVSQQGKAAPTELLLLLNGEGGGDLGLDLHSLGSLEGCVAYGSPQGK